MRIESEFPEERQVRYEDVPIGRAFKSYCVQKGVYIFIKTSKSTHLCLRSPDYACNGTYTEGEMVELLPKDSVRVVF